MTWLDVVKLCAPLLAEVGFKKRAGAVFTVDFDEDVVGWLGLNRATQHLPAGEVEVSPVVGVRHQGVERIVAECRDERFHPYEPPTVSTPLGYLLPEARYIAWTFGADTPADDVAREMTSAIEEHGLSFMQRTSTLPELCRRLEEGMGFQHQLAYRRPVALLLAGQDRRARQELDSALDELGDRDDLAAQELRRFAVALRRRMDEVRSGR